MANVAVAQEEATEVTTTDDVATEAEDARELDVITVTGTRRVIQDSITLKRSSTQIVDGLSADEIGDIPALSIGEALEMSRAALAPMAHCARRVIDVSGDGESNEGVAPVTLRALLRGDEITVNAIAIETDDAELTAYFFENLITGPGAFVVTANGFADYPEQIKRKLQRETTRQVTDVAP